MNLNGTMWSSPGSPISMFKARLERLGEPVVDCDIEMVRGAHNFTEELRARLTYVLSGATSNNLTITLLIDDGMLSESSILLKELDLLYEKLVESLWAKIYKHSREGTPTAPPPLTVSSKQTQLKAEIDAMEAQVSSSVHMSRAQALHHRMREERGLDGVTKFIQPENLVEIVAEEPKKKRSKFMKWYKGGK